ncbi:MAG: hypothetical protein HYR73_04735 [Candidatus Eisenbacteria bacterium]|nr:hypothetical protein [Candidatus Eisenbacteria bacterium]
MRFRTFWGTLALSLALSSPAHALISLGAQAPYFSKSVLGGGTTSLPEYSGKILVLFLLGYG